VVLIFSDTVTSTTALLAWLTLMVLMMQIPHGRPLMMIVKPLIQMTMPQRLPLLLV
jgi:hypothetical protein